jgi:peptide-methionine (R)-S-oxide reductase
MKDYPVRKTDAEWKAQLDPMQFEVTRHAATERAFTGKYWDHWEPGRYDCVGCGTPLFAADTKFDAGCGWPSYWQPINSEVVERVVDKSHGMVRIEVRCNNCGAHLGWFHNPIIIKWKPSIAYWALGLSFWVSRLVGNNLLEEMLGGEFVLPHAVWQRLNFAWIAFLGFMGVLNLYVAYTFSTSTWASFKVFGATGLMLAFSLGQVVYLSRHMQPEATESKPPEPAP